MSKKIIWCVDHNLGVNYDEVVLSMWHTSAPPEKVSSIMIHEVASKYRPEELFKILKPLVNNLIENGTLTIYDFDVVYLFSSVMDKEIPLDKTLDVLLHISLLL